MACFDLDLALKLAVSGISPGFLTEKRRYPVHKSVFDAIIAKKIFFQKQAPK